MRVLIANPSVRVNPNGSITVRGRLIDPDRTNRREAAKNIRGEKQCAICGTKRGPFDRMHLDGNERHNEAANLAYGCRSCNTKLGYAFQRIGAGKQSRQWRNQYNPSSGKIPTFAQYGWAVSNHSKGSRDQGGAIIHATPKHKRIEYARRIADIRTGNRRDRQDEVPF
jgi:hypothetical protein